MKDLLSLENISKNEISALITVAQDMKKNPKKYENSLKAKTLLMLFEKPSLRTRISFEVAINKLGGRAIVMETKNAPFKEKESISDTAKVSSRYCDAIMARLFSHADIEEMALNATIPVINGLTNTFHPCQILSDLFTIYEKKKSLNGLKLCFVGDGNNNITHDLLLGCAEMGIEISVGSPKEMQPDPKIVQKAKDKAKNNKSKITITNNAQEAAHGADILYADSWMSYHISEEEKEKRFKLLLPFQVNAALMKKAKKDALFMNCLPAQRGVEQTAEVIDGKQSIVFDQAENRLHMQKAILLTLLK